MKALPTSSKAVYSVVKERGKRANMVRVGQAISNSDGSIMVYLDAWPLSGTLLIRGLPKTESLPSHTPSSMVPIRDGRANS